MLSNRRLLAGCMLLGLVGAAAQAQQTTGVIGSPDASDGQFNLSAKYPG